jgi:hypothetical protein
MNHPFATTSAPLDLDAIAEWKAGVDRAKRAYYGSAPDYYTARTAASQKQLRYRARKKEQAS